MSTATDVGDGDTGFFGGDGGGSKEQSSAEPQPRTRIPGEIELTVHQDHRLLKDVGDTFSFTLEIRATYPALCTLKSWDPKSTYLSKIVSKLQKQGADITQPLTEANFTAMMEKYSVTATQKQELQRRIALVLTQIINGTVSNMDPKKAK